MAVTNSKKIIKPILWTLAIITVLLNSVAIFHAYKFTHYANTKAEKTRDSGQLSVLQKLSTLFFGISNPRPANTHLPTTAYETLRLNSNKEIECWYIPVSGSKGTVVLFHGYSGQKSSLIEKADLFAQLGFSTLLVDFMGSGGSDGNQTTIGFKEGEQVKTCYEYIRRSGEKNIFLFGTSMGAVAIMKAIKDSQIQPKGIILECPFGSMYKTVCARFKTMNVPTIPMAGLLVFWGGVQNGFWAFAHNPATYAKEINCPTLLMFGSQDEKVSRTEIDDIFANLKGRKTLSIYENAGHENYLLKHKIEWVGDVTKLLSQECVR